MIVIRIGYLKIEDVEKLENFSIYHTNKNTHILVKDVSDQGIYLCYVKEDRLPWKVVDGKKICTGQKVFDSNVNSFSEINTSNWNNGNQIMAYESFFNTYKF